MRLQITFVFLLCTCPVKVLASIWHFIMIEKQGDSGYTRGGDGVWKGFWGHLKGAGMFWFLFRVLLAWIDCLVDIH